MSDIEKQEKDEGLELAKKLAEEEEGVGRIPKGGAKYVIPTVAVIWSFFQLSIASWLILDTVYVRAIHLGFALLVVFLNFPFLRKTRFGLKFLSATDKIPVLDYVIAIIAAFSAIYIMVDFGGIIERYGDPNTRDIVVGLALTVLLLEASRRVIGPALPAIATGFIAYSFLGPYMPDLIAFKGVSLERFIGQMTPLGCFGHHCLPVRSLWCHAGQGRGGQVFHQSGLESSGGVQGRAGQGCHCGQRAHRPGVRLEHRQYRYHRHLHHTLDEKGGIPRRLLRWRWRPAPTASSPPPSWARQPLLSPNMSMCPTSR
jgi:hypothetical protein